MRKDYNTTIEEMHHDAFIFRITMFILTFIFFVIGALNKFGYIPNTSFLKILFVS